MADQRGADETVTDSASAKGRNIVRLLRGWLLVGFAALIAKLFIAGEMTRYMAPALDPLMALTGVVVGAMGVMGIVARAWPREQQPEHSVDLIEQVLTCVLVILPLGLGLLVTPRALGVGALGGDSVTRLLLAYAPGQSPGVGATPPAPSKPIEDTADLLAYLRQAGLSGTGQRVRVAGLAIRDESLGANEFALLRYAITHCVADARPLALLVTSARDRAVRADQWVEVEGVLTATERDGSQLVTIAALRVRPTPEPSNPYLGSTF
jgi:uncharacterized repeat protein (TIGR03943 family)